MSEKVCVANFLSSSIRIQVLSFEMSQNPNNPNAESNDSKIMRPSLGTDPLEAPKRGSFDLRDLLGLAGLVAMIQTGFNSIDAFRRNWNGIIDTRSRTHVCAATSK